MKRTFDAVATALALIVLSPLLVPIMVILKLTGEGEIFYLQERMGRDGEPFNIVKFATMLKDSPNLPGGDITVTGDPRTLPVGRVLRKTKINELPQLWNVLIGEMSLIGPRPLTPRVYDAFPQSYKSAVARVRPGLSGIGSVIFRDEETLLSGAQDRERTYNEIIVPYKSSLETWYVENQSFWLDIKLILLTVAAIVLPEMNVQRFLQGAPLPPQQHPSSGGAL